MARTSIGDYALLSDCQSAALVGRDGSADWYCPPRFDAPSVFARLLDPEGGHWYIRPVGEFETTRAYMDDTMVLRTEFSTPRGRAVLVDALAFERGARGHEIGLRAPHVLLRRVEGIEGEVEVEMEFAPRMEYALTVPRLSATDTGVLARGGPTTLYLISGRPLRVGDAEASTRFKLRAGEAADFALLYGGASSGTERALDDLLDVRAELENTSEGWKSWAEIHRGYKGPYVDHVRRSALVLQALTYQPTGAVVAAATTSLPEEVGASANWDYRFTWLSAQSGDLLWKG